MLLFLNRRNYRDRPQRAPSEKKTSTRMTRIGQGSPDRMRSEDQDDQGEERIVRSLPPELRASAVNFAFPLARADGGPSCFILSIHAE